MSLQLTDNNFNETLETDKPVLVDFWAEWCGPCRMVGPIVDELSNELGDKAVVGKLDVDKNMSTAAKFGIRSIPTLLVFKNGEVVDKVVGATSKQDLINKLESQMN